MAPRSRLSLLAAIGRHAASVPDRTAHALILRDIDHWLRLQFLGVGLALVWRRRFEIRQPWTTIAENARVTDLELLTAVLQVGVALGELSHRRGRYEIRGSRLRAIAGRSSDLAGLVEELVDYDSPIYTRLGDHLRGAPAGAYLDGTSDAIAQASRLAEPILGPTVRSVRARHRSSPGR